MGNRLGSSTSPYLRQHADDPVDWVEWGPAAFAEARRRDVPVLLSIGYAACHWCHVMAHESFTDPATADLMNAHFVCVKVDREERPDVDAVYMNATVAMTGGGGWPMTCFLTPDGDPFHCGTYHPPEPRGGRASFQEVMGAVREAWGTRRGEVDGFAARVRTELRRGAAALPEPPVAGTSADVGAGPAAVTPADLDRAAAVIARTEDRVDGGFGVAPKFPPTSLLAGLARVADRTGDPVVAGLVERTLDAMAAGGIHDLVEGGFARYAVDSAWVIPHFEKMLFDNALLLRAYADRIRRGGDVRRHVDVAVALIDWLERRMWTGAGYAASLDADTIDPATGASVEGLTYVWTPAELVGVLGEEDGARAAELFGVTAAGTFEHGSSTLRIGDHPAAADGGFRARILPALREARARRPQPRRDDKVVTEWNAMAAVALVEASRALRVWAHSGGAAAGDPEGAALTSAVDPAATADLALRRARDVVRSLLAARRPDGFLPRASLGGVVGTPTGSLADHAWTLLAVVRMHEVDAAGGRAAASLVDAIRAGFADAEAPGSWFDAVEDRADAALPTRPRDVFDGATPAGASIAAEALAAASCILVDADLAATCIGLAARTVSRHRRLFERAAPSAGQWLAAAEAVSAGPVAVTVAGPAGAARDALLAAALGAVGAGGLVLEAGEAAGAGATGGVASAVICAGGVCTPPLTDPRELTGRLRTYPLS